MRYCQSCGAEADSGAMCRYCGATTPVLPPIAGVPYPPSAQVDPQYQQPLAGQVVAKRKIVAGLLGLFLGSLGIHNIYLGYHGKALAQFLILAFVLSQFSDGIGLLRYLTWWGPTEGVLILMGYITSDARGIPLR